MGAAVSDAGRAADGRGGRLSESGRRGRFRTADLYRVKVALSP